MAKFSVNFDTDGGISVDMDGQTIENVVGVYMYKYDDAQAECSIETREKAAEGVWKRVSYMSRTRAQAEVAAGKATASQYGDLVRVEGYSNLANELCELLKK